MRAYDLIHKLRIKSDQLYVHVCPFGVRDTIAVGGDRHCSLSAYKARINASTCPCLCLAAALADVQLFHLNRDHSCSVVLRHFVFGLPTFLLPSGCHATAAVQILLFCIQSNFISSLVWCRLLVMFYCRVPIIRQSYPLASILKGVNFYIVPFCSFSCITAK